MRADLTMLSTFTGVSTELGSTSAGISAEGLQDRWVRGDASIDVLLPDGIGERASLRSEVTGSPTLPTAGGTQSLQRSETVAVTVAGRDGPAGQIASRELEVERIRSEMQRAPMTH